MNLILSYVKCMGLTGNFLLTLSIYGLVHDKSNKIISWTSEDLDQPGQQSSHTEPMFIIL